MLYGWCNSWPIGVQVKVCLKPVSMHVWIPEDVKYMGVSQKVK